MKMLKKYQVLLFSIAGGLLMSAAWPQNGMAVLLFFAMIPFLIVEDQVFRFRTKYNRFAVFFYSYPGFFVWNVLTTWWIYNSTFFGAAMAVMFNALFMALVFQFYHYCRKILTRNHVKPYETGFFVLIIYWVTFEYLHLNWELSWPWLQLGNGFASVVKSIQWYEYTGVLGGTIWILTMNVLWYRLLQMVIDKENMIKIRKFSVLPLLVLIVPLILSWIMYYSYNEKNAPVDIVVVQPNVDPYGEKFDARNWELILEDLLIGQSLEMTDNNTDFIVWPETSIPGTITISEMDYSYDIDRIKHRITSQYPNLRVVSGANMNDIYDTKKTATARFFKNPVYDVEYWWDSFNSAVEVDSSGIIGLYHKSKLVPGVERMPYPHLFRFLEKYAIDLGGTTGSQATSPEPMNFINGKVPVAPVICYESIFGEYVTGYIRKGAQLIFIVTNDGWWGETPGYRQHFAYASLRAIETRRSIARSANTGISGFINQRGDVIQEVPYDEKHVIRNIINANDKLTVYVKYGDYLGRLSGFASIAVVFIVIVKLIFRRKSLKREAAGIE